MKSFLSDILSSIRGTVQNHTDEAVFNATCDNIFKATLAMLEADVNEDTIKMLLVKHWDMRPSEATEIVKSASEELLNE